MKPPRGFFVTGTDTGVGKTVGACAALRALRARGLEVGAMKPVETGVGPDGPQDALALQHAAGGRDPLEIVCPLRFALPTAPTVAAADEGRAVELERIDAAFAEICDGRDLVVVEGAGGLLVPVAPGVDMADLARRLSLPLLVVARTQLGTINHTRLTLEVARARGLQVLGVVLNHTTPSLSDADAANLEVLRREVPLLGEVHCSDVPARGATLDGEVLWSALSRL